MKNMRKKIGAIMVGMLVILAGVGYALRSLGYDFDLSSFFFDGWWTVFIIVPGVLRLFDKSSNKVFAVVLIAVGVGLLVSQLFKLSLGPWVAPVIIIAVGVSIVGGAFRDSNDTETPDGNDNDNDNHNNAE